MPGLWSRNILFTLLLFLAFYTKIFIIIIYIIIFYLLLLPLVDNLFHTGVKKTTYQGLHSYIFSNYYLLSLILNNLTSTSYHLFHVISFFWLVYI